MAIMGESGSGKTTLLNILAALDRPTAGEVLLNGKIPVQNLSESKLAAFRRDNLGFVFQEFNLLDTFSMQDNIYLPLVLAGKSYREMKGRLEPIAARLGITRAFEKISLRGIRRAEAAGGGGPGADYRSAADSGRRAYRRAGFPGY